MTAADRQAPEVRGWRDALVVGAGVSGLTCGVVLAEAGIATRVVARERSPETTSDRAAAIWYPYFAQPRERVLRWAAATLAACTELAGDPASGVRLLELMEGQREELAAEPWWGRAAPAFRRARPEELPPLWRAAFIACVPLMEAPLYLPYLERRLAAAGGSVESGEVRSLTDLAAPRRLVVNCTGLGAAALCGDQGLFPIRGQVARMDNPGLERAFVDESDPDRPTYVVPRSADCVLGGSAEVGDWSLSLDPATGRDIVARASAIVPALAAAEVRSEAVGLRPGRATVRLEAEDHGPACRVIHNYGHGGAGFTLSWGCAQEVLELARRDAPDAALS